MMNKIIALYLPQFHEFEENNNWWGKGFTEWTCVNKAKPRSNKHKILKPHPDIGQYSLIDVNVRRKQATMAKQCGLYGFCYYHYWFGDKVLMDSTLQLMLIDGEPDLPFCLSWANEPWTRRMNGGSGELLQPNNYGDEQEWESHLQYLLPFFKSKNYIKIDNKPVFVIYRVSQIPNCEQRLKYWKDRLKQLGFEGMFVVMTIGNFRDDFKKMCDYTDATFDFYPNFLWEPSMISEVIGNVAFYDMNKVYERIVEDKPVHTTHFKGTMVGFDSSPRSPLRCNVFINGSPKLFMKNLNDILSISNEEFVFVNAWNEWGEGCALEPSEEFGYEYMNCIKKSIGLRNIKC